jgi:hypothetical protein
MKKNRKEEERKKENRERGRERGRTVNKESMRGLTVVSHPMNRRGTVISASPLIYTFIVWFLSRSGRMVLCDEWRVKKTFCLNCTAHTVAIIHLWLLFQHSVAVANPCVEPMIGAGIGELGKERYVVVYGGGLGSEREREEGRKKKRSHRR